MNRRQRRIELARARKPFEITLPHAISQEGMDALRAEAATLGIYEVKFIIAVDPEGK